MFSVAVARLGGEVVALDASLYNLAYVRRSVELNSNLDNVKLVYNSIRWVPGELRIYERVAVGRKYPCTRLL